MKVLKAQAYVLTKISQDQVMGHLESAGRICYKSEDNIKPGSAAVLVRNLITQGHESVLEHIKVSALVICDRSISHQIVRHRLASYSQESQRYCNYSKEKFDGHVRFIIPTWLENEENLIKDMLVFGYSKQISSQASRWVKSMLSAERNYQDLLSQGWLPEQARVVLPNSTKTELIMSMNLREWRHFLKLRTSKSSDPQIRNLALKLLEDFNSYLPVIFEDIPYEEFGI